MVTTHNDENKLIHSGGNKLYLDKNPFNNSFFKFK